MKDLIGYPIIAIIVYLIWSFLNWSWDAGTWTMDSRFMAVMVWFLFGSALSYLFKQEIF